MVTISRPTLIYALLVVSLGTHHLVLQAHANDRTQSPSVQSRTPVASVRVVRQRTPGRPGPEIPSPVDVGAAAFSRRCTECHDAQTALDKTKDFADWLATIRRMAKKEDADIPQELHQGIARYLVKHGRATPPSPMAAPSGAAGAASGNQAGSRDDDGDGDGKQKNETGSSGKGFDASLVQAGETAFNRSCTSCHDAQKSLQASKSLAGWRTTVRRMAGKTGAQIPESIHESIATYLASRNEGEAGGKEDGGSGADGESQLSLMATVSPLWRGGGPAVQDPGFFPNTWVGAAWEGKQAVSARVTTCTTCHTESKFGLVEASVRFNLTKYLRSRDRVQSNCQRERQTDVAIEAGRFVVPFGAFYQQVNPGVYRTVSLPLIYNMGQRVYASDLSYPVLPMPYSDTGANTSIALPIATDLAATFDAYVVNGLQGGANGIDFIQTRQQFYDNNKTPSVGGRFTIGGRNLRLGTSVMGGRFNSNAGNGPFNQGMNYLVFGADAVFRWEDRLRLQFEYAQRNSDRLGNVPTAIFSERVGGFYLEGEALICRRWNLSFLARYGADAAQLVAALRKYSHDRQFCGGTIHLRVELDASGRQLADGESRALVFARKSWQCRRRRSSLGGDILNQEQFYMEELQSPRFSSLADAAYAQKKG